MLRFHTGIEILSLLLGDTFIEMTGRRQEQVFTVSFVHPFGEYGFIKDDGKEFLTHLINALPFAQRQLAGIHLTKCLTQVGW